MSEKSGSNGAPRGPAHPQRHLTLARETQRRAQKATVGEVEDGLRNLMRLVKAQFAARDALIADLMALVQTLDPGWSPPVILDGASDGVSPVTVSDADEPQDHHHTKEPT